MLGGEELQHTEGIDMNQVIDAMMPFFKLAIVLFVIETVFDMFWREHKKAKREREREKKREKRRQVHHGQPSDALRGLQFRQGK